MAKRPKLQLTMLDGCQVSSRADQSLQRQSSLSMPLGASLFSQCSSMSERPPQHNKQQVQQRRLPLSEKLALARAEKGSSNVSYNGMNGPNLFGFRHIFMAVFVSGLVSHRYFVIQS